jgi:hypothetical protein
MQEGGPCVARTRDLMRVQMGARHGKNDLKKKLRDEFQVHNFIYFSNGGTEFLTSLSNSFES